MCLVAVIQVQHILTFHEYKILHLVQDLVLGFRTKFLSFYKLAGKRLISPISTFFLRRLLISQIDFSLMPASQDFIHENYVLPNLFAVLLIALI